MEVERATLSDRTNGPMENHRTSAIRGVLPVIQTPFRADDSIDSEALAKEVDWLFANGVNGVVVAMVSEVFRLTEDERDSLMAQLVEMAAGRGPVIASVGGESAVQAVRNAKAAEARGASAVMAIPPALTRCAVDEMMRYYRAILDATQCPLVLQDASGYVGNAIPLAAQVALWGEYPGRILFKPEAQPVGPAVSALRDATAGRAEIFDGYGGNLLVSNFPRGIAGVMPGSEVPWAIVALWRALRDENEERARAIQGPLSSMIALQTTLDAFVAVEKRLLVLQGIFTDARARGPVGFVLDEIAERELLRLFRLLEKASGRAPSGDHRQR